MGLDIYFHAKSKNEKLREEYNELNAKRRDVHDRYDEAAKKEIEKISGTDTPMRYNDLPAEIIKKLQVEFEGELNEIKGKMDDCYNALYSEVAYFRKVNFLLPYFGYEENCSEIVIDKCEVEELINDCKRVLAAEDTDEAESVADELLPTEEGFFFGNTDYDERYFNDVQGVMDKFTEILDTFDFDENELVMNCWW